MIATFQGTPVTSPTNGTLYIYSDALALHHTRMVEYYMHDGYRKTAILTSSTRRYGVILKSETIDNACGDPVNGELTVPDGRSCHPVLHASAPAPYALGGDTSGRLCRYTPQRGFGTFCGADGAGVSPFDVHVTETATGSGQYLTVGGKEHGSMLEVSYYTGVGGTIYDMDIFIPQGTPALVTQIVLMPGPIATPSAVLVFQ